MKLQVKLHCSRAIEYDEMRESSNFSIGDSYVAASFFDPPLENYTRSSEIIKRLSSKNYSQLSTERNLIESDLTNQ